MKVKSKNFEELSLSELYEIIKARVNVFVVEQNCPYEDLDDRDQDAIHVWLENEDGIQAYLRVMAAGVEHTFPSLGRVLSIRRNKGFGLEVLRAGIKVAEDHFGQSPLYLEAQFYAKVFYEKSGFEQSSEPFLLDGIEHIQMIRWPEDFR